MNVKEREREREKELCMCVCERAYRTRREMKKLTFCVLGRRCTQVPAGFEEEAYGAH